MREGPLPSPPPARRPQSFLSFDFGTRRVGVAAGNALLGRAQGLKTVATEGAARFVGSPCLKFW